MYPEGSRKTLSADNIIRVMREPHMRHNVTQLEGKNDPVNFSHSVLENYFIELEPGNYQDEEADNGSDAQPNLLQFSRDDKVDCNKVRLVSDLESSNSSIDSSDKFWVLYFDGSKTQEGLGAGYVLMDLEKKNISFHVY